MIGIASLLVFLLLALLVTRVGTVALRTTGLSEEAARFQARSAFSGVGYTTAESEDIVSHPARRRVVTILMTLSSVGVVTTLGSLLLAFAHVSGPGQTAWRLGALVVGLLLLWAIAASQWVDQRLSTVIEAVLRRWSDLDANDYVRLLHISTVYAIAELEISPGEWLEGRKVGDLLLAKEGVVVLGLRRGRRYQGAPGPGALMRAGDVIVVYGRSAALHELESRQAGISGDLAHQRAVDQQERIAFESAWADDVRFDLDDSHNHDGIDNEDDEIDNDIERAEGST
jgi:hypothetical protein